MIKIRNMIVKDLHVSTTVVDLVDPFFFKKKEEDIINLKTI
jgi:hypothetical protein